MHQSIVSTAPNVHVMGGDNDFTFQGPGMSPVLLGQADGYNPSLSHTLHNRKFHQGKGPNVKPRHCGNNQKVIAVHLSPAIPMGVVGGDLYK